MRIKNILAIVLSSLLAAGTAQARDFRAADVHPLDYPTTMAVKRIGEIISKKTNGKAQSVTIIINLKSLLYDTINA